MADNGMGRLAKAAGLDTPASTPEDRMQLALEHMKASMPQQANAANVGPMNWLERMIAPEGADAITLPLGRVAYDPAKVGSQQADVDDVLAHELTHVKQGQNRSWMDALKAFMPGPAYLDRPDEKEAFGVEARRQAKRKDIELPAMRKNGQ